MENRKTEARRIQYANTEARGTEDTNTEADDGKTQTGKP